MGINNYPLIFKKATVNKYKKKDAKIKDIIDTFNISNGSLYNWINKDRNNNLDEKKKYTRCSKYLPHIKCYIRSYVLMHISFDMNKLIYLLKKKFDLIAKKSSIYNIIKKFNISYKKVKHKFIYGDKKKHSIKIKEFKKQIKKINVNDIISIDEVSVDTHINEHYGWGLKGKQIIKKINNLRKRSTIICAISREKILYYKIIKGSANAEDFLSFLKGLKIKNKYLLVDNARIHHSKIVKEYMHSLTNKFIFNVPYSPEYNPIEIIFSKFKTALRKMKNISTTKLIKNIKKSFNKINKKDIVNSYNKCLMF